MFGPPHLWASDVKSVSRLFGSSIEALYGREDWCSNRLGEHVGLAARL
jgi:hypothetical protein